MRHQNQWHLPYSLMYRLYAMGIWGSLWGYEWRHQGNFCSRTEVMLKSRIFAPFLTPQKERKLPLWEALSPVWKRNSIIASMAPFLSSWAIYRHLICPYYGIHVGCRGRGANDFAASSRFIKISLVKTFRLKWSVTNRRIDGRSPGGRSVPFVKVFCCTEILIYDNGTAFSILHKLDQSIELGAVSFRQT